MRRPSHLVLVDGALSANPRTQREAAVQHMAADLLKLGTYGSEREAIRSLFGRYRAGEIMALLDDARQLAAQEAVAEVMSAS
jgi:hypothetical protein